MVVSIASVLGSVWRHRFLSIAIVFVGVIASVAAALLIRPVYRAETVLLPATDESGMGDLAALAGEYGALAALAGVPIGKGGGRNEALGVLRSRYLMERFITGRDLLPVLFSKKWDAKTGAWRVGDGREPTIGDGLQLFERKIRQVREDVKSGLVTLRVDWYDRELVAEWANGMVELANEELRKRAIAEADSTLIVLERELARAQAVELKSALSRLIESQLKTRTIAAVRKEYAFKVIDPAMTPDPDKRIRPTRTLIVLLGAIGSVLIAVLVSWLIDQAPGRSTRASADTK